MADRITTRVNYEWTVEEIDADGEISEVHFSEGFPGFPHPGIEVGLLRHTENFLNDIPEGTPQGEETREYIYITDGVLPSHFDNGAAVPKRFLEEVSKAKEKTNAA